MLDLQLLCLLPPSKSNVLKAFTAFNMASPIFMYPVHLRMFPLEIRDGSESASVN